MILYAYLVFCYNLDFLKNTKPNLYKAFYKFYYTWMTWIATPFVYLQLFSDSSDSYGKERLRQ